MIINIFRRGLLGWSQRHSAAYKPNFSILQGEEGKSQLDRWHIIRTRFFGIYLHRFNFSDEDRALHDHPRDNISWVLGPIGYHEIFKDKIIFRIPGEVIFRRAETAHRIAITSNKPVFTLFFVGPIRRAWGFHCPQGWRLWSDFVDMVPGGNKRGKGCD